MESEGITFTSSLTSKSGGEQRGKEGSGKLPREDLFILFFSLLEGIFFLSFSHGKFFLNGLLYFSANFSKNFWF